VAKKSEEHEGFDLCRSGRAGYASDAVLRPKRSGLRLRRVELMRCVGESRKNPKGVTAKLYLAWITGYVSGASMHGPDQRFSDVDGLATFMDNICQKESLIPMVAAAKRLVDVLTGKPAQ
jgi:hypothetical protein